VDPELYDLFCRIAPPKKVAFARSMIERKVPLDEVARALTMTPQQGKDWFNELARRGVIKRAARGSKVLPRLDARPATPDRRTAVLTLVRAELGETPFVAIAEALDINLVSRLDQEMSFQDLVLFARVRGYDWRHVYVVLTKLTVKKLLQRLQPGAEIAPPPLVPGPDREDKQLQAWTEWARRAQPIWKSALG
jgi:hypothetical protein